MQSASRVSGGSFKQGNHTFFFFFEKKKLFLLPLFWHTFFQNFRINILKINTENDKMNTMKKTIFSFFFVSIPNKGGE